MKKNQDKRNSSMTNKKKENLVHKLKVVCKDKCVF